MNAPRNEQKLNSSASSRRTLRELTKQLTPECVLMGFRAWREARSAWRDSFLKDRRRHAAPNQVRSLLACSNGVPLKIELGAGAVRGSNGWTTVDTEPGADLLLDLREPLPFPDGSVGAFYSSHVFEHFTDRTRMTLLRECRRSLCTGGTFSVAVPNARLYLNSYFDSEPFDLAKHPVYKEAWFYVSKIDLINYIAYMNGQHHHLFDEENLIAVLREAEFRNVRLRDFDPQLDLLDRRHESIYAIAEK